VRHPPPGILLTIRRTRARDTQEATMKRSSLRSLIILNGCLLAALVAVTFVPTAVAQLRPRSTYSMVAGTVNGIVQGVVYINDETTNEVVALSWYENQKRLVGLGYRNMSMDAAQAAQNR